MIPTRWFGAISNLTRLSRDASSYRSMRLCKRWATVPTCFPVCHRQQQQKAPCSVWEDGQGDKLL